MEAKSTPRLQNDSRLGAGGLRLHRDSKGATIRTSYKTNDRRESISRLKRIALTRQLKRLKIPRYHLRDRNYYIYS